jgi:hypothetical protein
MKTIRLAGCMLLAISAASLTMSATATAGPYLFRVSNVRNIFSSLTLALEIRAAGDSIACKDGVSAGAIANVHLLGPFDIKFTSCVSSGSGGSGCAFNTPGAAEGEVLTHTLHALLGLVLPAVGLGLGGLLVLPASGKQFFTAVGNNCTPETAFIGSFAGLLEPTQVGKLVLESLILFIPGAIKQIDTLNGLVEPELVAFLGESLAMEAVQHLTWNKDTEIEVP